MKTYEDIKANCTDDGGCLIWQGQTNGSGYPKFGRMGVRRRAYELACGPLERSDLVTVTCGCSLCLEKTHLKKTNKAEVSSISNSRPATQLKRSASLAKANRPRLGKINMEIAQAIRASDKSGLDLAAELNVSPSLISNVRLNKSWRDYSNPFAGLGA